MDKIGMREWIATTEGQIDNKLKKWKKDTKIENGEAIQLRWQFEQTHFILDVFWEDYKETVQLQYISPRTAHRYQWHGLNDKSFNKLMDRVGNLAQITMSPPIDPTDG